MDDVATSKDVASPSRAGPGTPLITRKRDWQQLSALLQQLPPHAIEAEMSLLGSILIDPQCVGDVVFAIKGADDFSKPAHGAIYSAMIELYDKYAALDIVQLNQVLHDRKILETVGGVEYLVELANAVPSAANAVHYARLVREKAAIRQLIEATGETLYEAHEQADEARVILERAEERIFKIAQQSDQAQAQSLHELIKQTMDLLEANEGRHLTGVATGFAELDEMMSGLQRGDLIILAARPSMGKTALALNLAEGMAMHGTAVGIFSMEMSKQQLVQRLLVSRSGVDSHRMRRSMLNDDEHRALLTACDELLLAPIYIDDTPGLSLLQLRAKARRMAQKHGIGAIVIDYLQLMSSGRRVESRQIEVSEISRGVKAMARELNVPVICLSQLNRSPEMRAGHRPMMSDLRESGSIEQDADVVTMLHREDYYHKDDPEWAAMNEDKVGVAELILTKQRNGPTGVVRLTWISQSMRFRDYSSARQPGGYVPTTHYEPKPSPARAPAAAGASAAPFRIASKPTNTQEFRDGGGPDRDGFDDDEPLSDMNDGIPI